MTKPKFQFNLKTTLLVVTIAALAIFSYSQSVRIRELQDEANTLRDQKRILRMEVEDLYEHTHELQTRLESRESK